MESNKICCPKCSSDQITANTKGFSAGKAVAGAMLTGGAIGFVAGSLGKNKVTITCLNCGNHWHPGDIQKEKAKKEFNDRIAKSPLYKKTMKFLLISLACLILLIIILEILGAK